MTNPDWFGDLVLPNEFGLRRRTKPGIGVTSSAVAAGVDMSLPSAPLLANLRAIQVIASFSLTRTDRLTKRRLDNV